MKLSLTHAPVDILKYPCNTMPKCLIIGAEGSKLEKGVTYIGNDIVKRIKNDSRLIFEI